MSEKIVNNTGIIPVGFKVLIQLEELEETTKGGIILPSKMLETEQGGHQIAIILDHGPAAFTIGAGDLPREWDITPKVGAKVILNRYAGIPVETKDKKEYRLINDKEILAILSEEACQ